jgi:small neutral amino acid transporter SnatA (MarC family)
MSDKQSNKIPEKVVLAIRLFYFIIGMGFVRLVITVIRHWGIRTPDFIIMSKLIIWVVSLFFVYKVSKGRNWARWTMVAIFIISIPLAILPRISSLTHNPIPNLVGLVQVFLYVWAILLLFQATSNAWFKEKKEVWS